MTPEIRCRNLIKFLGWQGGTIHDACSEIEVDAHNFLYTETDFCELGPCHDFKNGFDDYENRSVNTQDHLGVLQYWFGVIAAVQAERGSEHEWGLL